MSKIIIKILIVLSIFTSTIGISFVETKAEETIVFEDKNFQYKIANILGKPFNEDITKEELLSIKKLELTHRDWFLYTDYSFKGIKQLENLEVLSVENISMTTLENIRDLKNLQELMLNGTHVKDLNPIQGMQSIKSLRLINNPLLTELATIHTLVNLEKLEIYRNVEIQEYPNLEGLTKLEALKIPVDHVTMKDLTIFEGLDHLKSLELTFEEDYSLSFLSKFSNLKHLTINGYYLGDFSGLDALTQLESIELVLFQKGEVADMHYITGNKNLKSLKISNKLIKNIDAMSSLSMLEHLAIAGINIGNDQVSVIGQLGQLLYLDISSTQITDLSHLQYLSKLETLHIADNEIVDISSLAQLRELKTLVMTYNLIEDISALKDLTKLEKLSIAENRIVDLAPLSKLVELKELSISFNLVEDISTLINHQKLETLELTGNKIKDISILKDLPALKYAYYSYQNVDLEIVWGEETKIDIKDYGNIKHSMKKEYTEDGKYMILLEKGRIIYLNELVDFEPSSIGYALAYIEDVETEEVIEHTDVEVNSSDVQKLLDNPYSLYETEVRVYFKVNGDDYETTIRVALFDSDNYDESDYFHLLKEINMPQIEIIDEGNNIILNNLKETLLGKELVQLNYYFNGNDPMFSGSGTIRVVKAKMIVHYMDTSGKALDETIVFEGKHGEKQELELKQFDNYRLISSPENNEAYFNGKETEIHYIYKEKENYVLNLLDSRMLEQDYLQYSEEGLFESYFIANATYSLVGNEGGLVELLNPRIEILDEYVDGESKHLIKLSGDFDGEVYEATAYLFIDQSYQIVGQPVRMLKSTYKNLVQTGEIEQFLSTQFDLKLVNDKFEVIKDHSFVIDLSQVNINEFGDYLVDVSINYQEKKYEQELNLTLDTNYELKADAYMVNKLEFFQLTNEEREAVLKEMMHIRLVDEFDNKMDIDDIKLDLGHIKEIGFGIYPIQIEVTYEDGIYRYQSMLELTSNQTFKVDHHTMLFSKYNRLTHTNLINDYLMSQMHPRLLDDDGKMIPLDSVEFDLSQVEREGSYQVNVEGFLNGMIFQTQVTLTLTNDESQIQEEEKPVYIIDAENFQIDLDELMKSFDENTIEQLLIERSKARLNGLSDRFTPLIKLDYSQIQLKAGDYSVYIVIKHKGIIYEKEIIVSVYKQGETNNETSTNNNDHQPELPKTGITSHLPISIFFMVLGVLFIIIKTKLKNCESN